jgi:hypothetical protein
MHFSKITFHYSELRLSTFYFKEQIKMNLLSYARFLIIPLLCCLSSISSVFATSADDQKESEDSQKKLQLAAPMPVDEAPDDFRKAINNLYALRGGVDQQHVAQATEEFREIERRFPGFLMIENHLACPGVCLSTYSQTSIKEKGDGRTLKDRFLYLTSQDTFYRGACWYNVANCKSYAFYTFVLESWPNKDEAVSIIHYWVKKKFYYTDFLDLHKIEASEEAQLVCYEKRHWGICRGNGTIESKWGFIPLIFRHKLFQVPLDYGHKVSFYKVGFKSLPPNFVEDNWPNPLWKLLHQD